MGDPIGAARHAGKALAPDGTVVLIEPFANDRVEHNVSPVARVFYSASTALCTAHAVSDGGRLVLGAQAGEARFAEVFRKAGFVHFRRALATPSANPRHARGSHRQHRFESSRTEVDSRNAHRASFEHDDGCSGAGDDDAPRRHHTARQRKRSRSSQLAASLRDRWRRPIRIDALSESAPHVRVSTDARGDAPPFVGSVEPASETRAIRAVSF